MTNHVHLIVIPERAESLPLALKQTHGRYASYLNARSAASGHVWQGRYYSCPLDPPHLWAALHYTELNPVRAGMVGRPTNRQCPAPPRIAAFARLRRGWTWSPLPASGRRPMGASSWAGPRLSTNWKRSAGARTAAGLSAQSRL